MNKVMKGFIVAIAAVGIIRFVLSVSGLPTILLALITVWIVWALAVMESRTREQTPDPLRIALPLSIWFGSPFMRGSASPCRARRRLPIRSS